MDSKDIENGSFTSETVGLLILNELRLMRRDMKVGLQRLDTKIDLIMEKKGTNHIVDVSSMEQLEEVEESFVNSTTNYINKDHVQSRAKKKSLSEDDKSLKEKAMIVESLKEPPVIGNRNVACTVHVDINELPEDDEDAYLYSYYDEEGQEHVISEYDTNVSESKLTNKNKKTKRIDPMKSSNGRYQCDRCSNSYTMKGNLRRHYRHHLNDKRFQCLICKRRFFRNEYLTRHMKNHEEMGELTSKGVEGEDVFSCSICNKSFSAAINLKRHMRAHTANKPMPYACADCDEKFSRENFLRRHIRKVHTVK